jgi:hypothetical protein
MSLLALPAELLEQILVHETLKEQIRDLCLINHTFCFIIRPHLLKRIYCKGIDGVIALKVALKKNPDFVYRCRDITLTFKRPDAWFPIKRGLPDFNGSSPRVLRLLEKLNHLHTLRLVIISARREACKELHHTASSEHTFQWDVRALLKAILGTERARCVTTLSLTLDKYLAFEVPLEIVSMLPQLEELKIDYFTSQKYLEHFSSGARMQSLQIRILKVRMSI